MLSFLSQTPPLSLGYGALRPIVRHLRAWPARASVEWSRHGGPRHGEGGVIAFLPSAGKKQSSLLRIYHIAHALRSLGWRTVVLAGSLTLEQRHQLLARLAPSVVVMQGSRHALNRPELYAGYRIVYDIDDADFHLPHLAQPVRDAMPRVTAVLAGSRYIADWCRGQGAGQVDVVWTGAPVSRRARRPHAKRGAVIAWAQTRPMTYIHEAALVRRFVGQLAKVHPDITLRLFDRQAGDDPAFAQSFKDKGVRVEWVKSCKYSDYLRHLDDVSLGLAPLSDKAAFSRGKSFGKVLAYLDRQVPVLASDACEHAAFFTAHTGVVSNDEEVWVTQANRLLRDAQSRQKMTDLGFAAFQQHLTSKASASRVADILQGLIS